MSNTPLNSKKKQSKFVQSSAKRNSELAQVSQNPAPVTEKKAPFSMAEESKV
eukprot:CAMPEP_0170452660 /NCGR_PEP_ID=MMETSP0123-20130129/1483_1 /TAXON_ID=182087 /ORGANISM="Favella ehrenbergii, Strain Fehren 1" /LENGTH=51 /DNA_ID=CAMNT_0010714737 /DNA_START=1239 /DNA_END=1394 /DNA_ORIENTATION=-